MTHKLTQIGVERQVGERTGADETQGGGSVRKRYYSKLFNILSSQDMLSLKSTKLSHDQFFAFSS